MDVEVVLAWPRLFESVKLQLAEGATVADALARSGLQLPGDIVAYAIHGVRVESTQPLGRRIEIRGHHSISATLEHRLRRKRRGERRTE